MNALEIVGAYTLCKSVRETARQLGISYTVVRRILITCGIEPSTKSEDYAAMRNGGMDIDLIALREGVTPKAVAAHLPYVRKAYLMDDRSINAIKISKWRSENGRIRCGRRRETP